MKPLRILSLFTGIGGFDLAFEQSGFKVIGQCEWDPRARMVLQHHWPDVPLSPDVQSLHGMDFGPAEVIAFGSPCQDLSVAGTRAGLDGNRSGLFFQALRIIQEMKEATHGRFPEFALWENVPGAFTSNRGRDFAAVLAGLAQLGALDIGWRMLDSQYAGVPQRRDRIFLIADFRAKRAQQILLEWPRLQRHPQTGRKSKSQNPTHPSKNIGGAEPILSLDHASTNPHINYGLAPTLLAGGGHGRGRIAICEPQRKTLDLDLGNQSGRIRINPEIAQTLAATNGGGGVATGLYAFPPHYRARRLTPMECERLQGFPDRWTATGKEGNTTRPMSDSDRYRFLGNTVTIPVVREIAERIKEALA